MNKILLILFITCLTTLAQNNQKVVRLSAEKEAWLEGDQKTVLDILLQKEATGNLDIATLYNIGYLYLLQGNYSRALLYLQTVVVREPSYPYPYLQIARIHEKIGNLYAARDHLVKGVNEDSDSIELLLELARISEAIGETDKAAEIYEQILDLEEDNVKAIVGLASIYRRQKKYEAAKELLEKNDAIFPEAVILLEKARLYRALDDKTKSQQFLTQILLDYPHSQKWAHIRDTLRIEYQVNEIPKPSPLPTYTYQINPKETLHYKVSYGPMMLGWLKIRIAEPETIAGKVVYPTLFFVDTNPSYGFILSLHHIYESYIEPATMNAVKTRLYTPGDDNVLVKVYYYNYDKNIFTAYIVHADGRFNHLTKDLPRKIQDSTSMLFFARGLVSDKLSGTTTVVIDEEFKYGHIKFLNQKEEISIGDKNFNTLKIFARADFEGVAGMNGDAWGWFATDEQAKPLKGAIEIIVGSITVEVDEDETVIPNFHEENSD